MSLKFSLGHRVEIAKGWFWGGLDLFRASEGDLRLCVYFSLYVCVWPLELRNVYCGCFMYAVVVCNARTICVSSLSCQFAYML